MLYNTGWGNLKPQQLKYTPVLAAKAAKLLQSGESLTATALAVKVSRASLRNWRSRDPRLNAAFATFEARKAEAKKKRVRVRHFKQVATEIVDAAREDAVDPVQVGLREQQKAEEVEAQRKAEKLSPAAAKEARLQAWFNSDWSELIEQQEARLEQAAMDREMELRRGFWTG